MPNQTVPTDGRLLQLAPQDNVCVATSLIDANETITIAGQAVFVAVCIPMWHKIAVAPIAAGATVVKCGMPIGSTTCDIAPGQHVHTHNVKSDYLPALVADPTVLM